MDDHFPASEFRCRGFNDGDKLYHPPEEYPTEWLHTRLPALKRTLEAIRHACGDHPVHILCGFRTVEYNAELRRRGLEGEYHSTGVALHSQHTEGRAADIMVFGMSPHVLHGVIMGLYDAGHMPELGGVGLYEKLGFVHVDTWKLATGELRRW
jgi:uncharacterized protein YcbK (DUF882 family)